MAPRTDGEVIFRSIQNSLRRQEGMVARVSPVATISPHACLRERLNFFSPLTFVFGSKTLEVPQTSAEFTLTLAEPESGYSILNACP